MSSDSRPSFRTYSKNKFKQLIKSNITSSIISNETLNKIREKSHNFTDNAKELVNYESIKNKTKSFIPGVLKQDENITSVKGFFDSLFSPQTDDDVYLKVAIICLWVIAMLFIILTMITMFITCRKTSTKTNTTKMIFFHLFLAEFFYLIYILFSMINVGLNFQLNSTCCQIAKYGMYATVPITCLTLLILAIERLTVYLNCRTSWTKIFTSLCASQSILLVCWTICVGTLTIFLYVKIRVTDGLKQLPGKILPTRFNFAFNRILSSKQCSIDGQLLPPFKILFIVLLIILIVLIIKSIVVSIIYRFVQPSCFKAGASKNKKTINHNMTLIYIIILLLNLILSFPFYFISAVDSISQFFGGDKPYPMKLKISFILRLSSIIFQCLVFYILENNSWDLLSNILNRATCQKFPVLKQDPASPPPNRKSISTKQSGTSNKSKNRTKTNGIKVVSNVDENNNHTELSDSIQTDTDDDDNDNVFEDEPKKKSPPVKTTKTPHKILIDEDDTDSDTEPEAKPQPKLANRKQEITSKSLKKRDEIEDEDEEEEEKEFSRRTTSKHNKTYDLIEPTSPVKSPSQRIAPATTTDRKAAKSSTTQDRTKYNHVTSTSSSDEISDDDSISDDETKPPVAKPTIQSTSNKRTPTSPVSPKEHQSSSNKRTPTSPVSPKEHQSSSNKRTPTSPVSPNEHHSSSHQHRSAHSKVSSPTRTKSSTHNHTETRTHRRRSPRHSSNHREKRKQTHSSKVYDNSHEV